MNEFEKLVFKRYEELGGLIKDSRMVNKDKESRARQYVHEYFSYKKKLIDAAKKERETRDNSKYGKFILQTNKVQNHLARLILLRSFNPSKRFADDLERSQFGQLIGHLNICAQSSSDLTLINQLIAYKKSRDRLAHKMFTDEKLTINECDEGIRLGITIIDYLVKSLKGSNIPMLKGSDKIADFPKQFNALVKTVEMLEKRIALMEKTNKKRKKK